MQLYSGNPYTVRFLPQIALTRDPLIRDRLTEIDRELNLFINQRNYPCVAARAAFKRNDYRLKLYREMGSPDHALELGRGLLSFRDEQQKTKSPYLSFIAVYDDCEFETEEAYEAAMWKELSNLASVPELEAPWDPNFSANPEDKNFCFSLGGTAFFVVGLHPMSSRLSRRFYKPAIVFNLFEQFENLDETTEFYPMVKANRKRELAFQGDLNPMVEQWAEKWESIQFSGRNNPPNWKCPFHRALRAVGLL